MSGNKGPWRRWARLLGAAALLGSCRHVPAAPVAAAEQEPAPVAEATAALAARTAGPPERFSAAKSELVAIYTSQQRTFYCDCPWDDSGVDLNACGYRPRRNPERAQRVEWEHVVPASWFGRSFLAWTEGHPDCVRSNGTRYKGRRCARKVSALFRRMEADMHNLVPSVGEVNGDRSNYPMVEIAGEVREYGACDVEIDAGQVEPSTAVRGDVARIHLYMAARYPVHLGLSPQQLAQLQAWSQADPVDRWECERNDAIADIMGWPNLFVSAPCAALRAGSDP